MLSGGEKVKASLNSNLFIKRLLKLFENVHGTYLLKVHICKFWRGHVRIIHHAFVL